jgi:CRP-like cAMP-binding protein
MISQAQIKEFREGEYIIKQGEVGEELFIILEGACEVVEDKNFLKSSSKDKDEKDKASSKDKDKDKTGKETQVPPNIVKLVTLREGHFFGEMSLMTVRTE